MKKSEKSILFVDGNTVRKKRVSSRLRMQGYKTELANGGFHAIQLVEKRVFDLVIIQGNDLDDMPAEEVVGLLRNIHPRPELPILAILLEADDESAATLAEAGASEIFIDSGNFNHILQEVKKIFEVKK